MSQSSSASSGSCLGLKLTIFTQGPGTADGATTDDRLPTNFAKSCFPDKLPTNACRQTHCSKKTDQYETKPTKTKRKKLKKTKRSETKQKKSIKTKQKIETENINQNETKKKTKPIPC
ncbi:hypothetical protein HanPI659440_Chr03g0127221 [Helianthus annuus]|nr:hypothetical protein HanPI659440_Chr03g0127221 [Helianthus annuus]